MYTEHAHQQSNAHRALTEFVELDKAIGIAKSMTSESDTLIIATGDHSQTFNFGGYAGRGNSVFGKEDVINHSIYYVWSVVVIFQYMPHASVFGLPCG